MPSGIGEQIVELARYLGRTEVHTYAFSVAANVILSLFPFIVLLLTITRRVLHSRAMEAMVGDMMHSFLPVAQDFIMRNMQLLAHPRKGTQLFSLVMLLITSTGVFLPLEVALNHVWGVQEEPLLPAQPTGFDRSGLRRRRARDGLGRSSPPGSRRS